MYLVKADRLKKLKAHQTKLEKDYNKLVAKINYSKEKKLTQHNIISTCQEIDAYQSKNERLFALNHFHEKELKNYYSEIRSRAWLKTEDKDDDIQRIAEKNISFIKIIQEYIALELDKTKGELEYESVERFQESKKKQDAALSKIIQSEKLIFEKMALSVNKIAKIKNDFNNINQAIQKQIEDNRLLKIKYNIAQYENKCLQKKIKELIKKKESLILLSNTKLGINNDVGNNDNYADKDKGKDDRKLTDSMSRFYENVSNIKTTANITNRSSGNLNILHTSSNRNVKGHGNNHHRNHTECAIHSNSHSLLTRVKRKSSNDLFKHFDTQSYMNEQMLSMNNNNTDLSVIATKIKELTKVANREHFERLVRNNKIKRKKKNMDQLIQKSIEDISYNYSILCSPHNTQYEEIKEIEKKKYTNDLEIITYIFDNWLFKSPKESNNNGMSKSKSCRLKFKRK